MMARTKFLKMCYKMPDAALDEFVYDFTNRPMTLRVCQFEVKNKTVLGDEILEKLGYKDD